MLLIRAFNEKGEQWLDVQRQDWEEAEPLLDQLDLLCPESKVSIVDLKRGDVLIKDRKPLAELNR